MRLWKYVSARALAADLTEAGYPVSKDTVLRWKRRGRPDPRAADKVYALLGVRPTTTKEAAEPSWVQRLEQKVDAIAAGQSVLADDAVTRLTRILATGESERMRVMRAALADALAETSPYGPQGAEPASGSTEDGEAGESQPRPRPSARPR